MNGYLNNLTLRTLNAGNRVEPRLPALFEPGAFESGPPAVVGRSGPDEEDVTTVSEAAAPRVKTQEPGVETVAPHKQTPAPRKQADDLRGQTEARSSGEAFSDGPSDTRAEIEAGPAVEVGMREPVFREHEREDTIETLAAQATLQPLGDPPLEIDESLNSSLEYGGLMPLRPRSNFVDNKTASRRLSAKSGQTEQSGLSPTQAPATHEVQTQDTLRQTTPANEAEAIPAAIEATQNEEFSEAERRVANEPEPEAEFESTSPYRRVNPTPATWRDTRQQQRRGRQAPAFESEPSINVTIGRIEVRAVPADNRKTTAPRRSESPVMPLEDYLRKQRRGGER